MALDCIASVRGRVFNLGGGSTNSISLLELIDHIAALTNRAVKYSFADWRPGDQPWYVSDTRALLAALGWRPKVSFDEGLRSLHRWLDSRFSASLGNWEARA
jgi:CDP-paratose 2-epimerase